MNDLNALAVAWWKIFRNQRITVRQVIITAIEGGDETVELCAALAEIAPSDYPGLYSPHRLGRWLAQARRTATVADDKAYQFVSYNSRSGPIWQLIPSKIDESLLVPPEYLEEVA